MKTETTRKTTYINPPEVCDVCRTNIADSEEAQPVFYDTKTKMGPWACLCPDCYRVWGLGHLGMGLGQKYERKGDRWVKVAG